ncbi:metallophosphoesterase [Lactiplantibacillus garii]|uniref:Metallophosphoesterase n=1 Tax=Lactiplantibacillus garii TaxID=2306423 RepID=A0A3R8J5N2_9LACO|nr:metallophosphoesterase family protein [Lactiplantibacillus garii]RRK09581.1 metallophosphoesterase [Lactiplantibacillus garii]
MLRKIAVLADVHGNLSALNAVLEDAKRAGATDYWFLGDLFLPGPGTQNLYDTLKTVQPKVWLQGNWEQGINAVMTGEGHWDNASEIYFARLTEYLVKRLAPDDYQQLVHRPIATSVTVNGLTFGLSHNQPERSTGHDLYPAEDQANFDHLAGTHDVAIYGHTHQQLMRVSSSGQLIINPGATGQPYSPYAKFLADQRAHYAFLMVTDAGQLTVDFRKVAYDVEAEIATAKARHLPYLKLYEHLRRTGLTSTHDAELLARVNAEYGYAAEVENFFQYEK